MTLEIGAKKKTLEDNIAVFRQLTDNIYSLKNKVDQLTPSFYNDIKSTLNAWLEEAGYPIFQEEENVSNFENWKALIKKNIAVMKYKQDGKGDLIPEYSWDRGKVYERDKEGKPLKVYAAEVSAFEPNYYFNQVTLPLRDVQKAYETYFAPMGIPFDVLSPSDPANSRFRYYNMPDNEFVTNLRDKYQNELENYRVQLEELESPTYLENLRREILERIEDMRVDTKDLNKVVADFGKLNYLLSDKRVTIQPSEVAVIEPTPTEVVIPEKSPKEVLLENIQLMKDLLSLVEDKEQRKIILNAIKEIKDILPLV
jgi:hypothetical protein